MHQSTIALAILTLGLLAAGCSQEARDELADKLQQGADTVAEKAGQATEAAASVTEQATSLVDAGSIEIQLADSQSITASGCFSQWLMFSDGRPSVLQLASYSDAKRETFPSIFVRAIVDPEAAEIFNQTLKAKMFVQPAEDGPIFYTADDALVDLAIGPPGDSITATLTAGQLLRSDSGVAIPAQGSLVFSLK